MEKTEIANILLKINAVTLRTDPPFTWTSGWKSPIYCDSRLLMSYPEERIKVIQAFLDAIKENNIEFDIVAGIATSGIPHAAWIADKLNKPMVYIRGSAKGHGKENRIEGTFEKGKKVLVIEDLVSTGGSSVSGVRAVKEAGGVVDYCLAIFTYGFDTSKQAFKQEKTSLITLTDFPTLIETAIEKNHIKEDQRDNLLAWAKDPANWKP